MQQDLGIGHVVQKQLSRVHEDVALEGVVRENGHEDALQVPEVDLAVAGFDFLQWA